MMFGMTFIVVFVDYIPEAVFVFVFVFVSLQLTVNSHTLRISPITVHR